MTRAFVFPGQGSQAVGMGVDWPAAFAAAREVFEEVDEALKQKLSKLMFEGPETDLTLTENAQPALMAVSIAVAARAGEGRRQAARRAWRATSPAIRWANIRRWRPPARLQLADAARLLKLRGQAMQKAVPVGEGAMAALLGLELEPAQEACQGGGRRARSSRVANDNAPGQVVVSGHKAAVERAIEIAKPSGAKRGMLLPVSAPFHCALMQPAADAMAEALATVTLGDAARAAGGQRDGAAESPIPTTISSCWWSR